ncbi:MAG: hypothetical protein M1827_002064 [Pycnora praestabilis]|nr:MAG: hypothetical protein M1827_002064 [Pycnora praestabilis]
MVLVEDRKDRRYADQPYRDAWNQQKGISKTEAKRRDARELVSELEFVWDQIKSNVPSSSSSSPFQTLGAPQPSYPSLSGGEGGPNVPMRELSPTTQGDEDEAEGEVYDDARDGTEFEGVRAGEVDEGNQRRENDERRVAEARSRKWQRRVEQALVKMTAEVAALREQLESRRLYAGRQQHSLWAWISWLIWMAMKHVFIDAVILSGVLLWMRKRRDRRLELVIKRMIGIVKERIGNFRLAMR